MKHTSQLQTQLNRIEEIRLRLNQSYVSLLRTRERSHVLGALTTFTGSGYSVQPYVYDNIDGGRVVLGDRLNYSYSEACALSEENYQRMIDHVDTAINLHKLLG